MANALDPAEADGDSTTESGRQDESGVPQEVKNELPLFQKGAYGVGHVLNDLCASVWFTYLILYYHLVLQFSNRLSGFVMLTGQIADAVSTPFVGIESDRNDNFWLCRYGRRKTWHLLGTVCVMASFPLLFLPCLGCQHASQSAQFVYYVVLVCIFQFGWASVQISHLALIPDLTLCHMERTGLNALRYAMTVISNVCVYITTWVVLGVSTSAAPIEQQQIGPHDQLQFRNIVLILVAAGSVLSLGFHVFVRERTTPLAVTKLSGQLADSPVRRMTWRHWFAETQFYQVALLYMSTRVFVNLFQVYLPLYLQESLFLHSTSIAKIPLVMFGGGFVASLCAKPMNQVAGRKVTYLIGSCLGLGTCVWIYLGRGESYSHISLYGVAVMMGAAGSIMIITSLSITNDLIGLNVESGAFVFGAMSFVDKLANGLAVMLVQCVHPCEVGCPDCAYFYRYVLSLGCGAAGAVASLALISLIPCNIGVRPARLSESESDNLLTASNASI